MFRRYFILLLILGSSLAHSIAQGQQRFAVIVGVSEYTAGQGLAPLPYAASDAVRLGGVLKKNGYETWVLTPPHGDDLLTIAPTRAGIESILDFGQVEKDGAELLDRIPRQTFTDKDTILVALIGYGVSLDFRVDDIRGFPRLHSKFYFCPSDARLRMGDGEWISTVDEVTPQHHLISLDEIYQRLARSGAGKKIVLIDARRSPANGQDKAISRPFPPRGVDAMFSCSSKEVAWDDKELGAGLFVHEVVNGLKGRADGTAQFKYKNQTFGWANGQVEFEELGRYVTSAIKHHMQEHQDRFKGTLQSPLVMSHGFNWQTPLVQSDPLVGKQPGEFRKFGPAGGIEFCWRPPGDFMMGEFPSKGLEDLLPPQVPITLTNGFWIGRTEVTQQQWVRVMQTDPWRDIKDFDGVGADFPAVNLSWEDATEFCQKLTAQEREAGRLSAAWSYRLPTDAEWEYACRGGESSTYSFGADPAKLGEYGWFEKNATHPQPVAQKKPNPCGLYDCHGNVDEWCADWHVERLSTAMDPDYSGRYDHLGKRVDHNGKRVVRGGSFYNEPEYCTSAARYGGYGGLESKSSATGLRLVLSRIPPAAR